MMYLVSWNKVYAHYKWMNIDVFELPNLCFRRDNFVWFALVKRLTSISSLYLLSRNWCISFWRKNWRSETPKCLVYFWMFLTFPWGVELTNLLSQLRIFSTEPLESSGSGVYLLFIFCQEIGVSLFEENVWRF